MKWNRTFIRIFVCLALLFRLLAVCLVIIFHCNALYVCVCISMSCDSNVHTNMNVGKQQHKIFMSLSERVRVDFFHNVFPHMRHGE